MNAQQQIPGRRVVEERRGEGEHHVKLASVSRAGQIGRIPGERSVKNEHVVRAEIVGKGRAQLGDGAARRRGENPQSHRARAGGTGNCVGTIGELGEEGRPGQRSKLRGIVSLFS